MNLKLRGIHATSISYAKTILNDGPKSVQGGRAGSGFYLWSYFSNRKHAIELARDWHEWKLEAGSYADCAERGFAFLDCEISVDPKAYVNLNQALHHETLRVNRDRLPRGEDPARVYDEYVNGLSMFRQEKFGTPLKIVEAMVPFPLATKRRHDGPPLTPGADAYIVLPTGLSELVVVDVNPANLRR